MAPENPQEMERIELFEEIATLADAVPPDGVSSVLVTRAQQYRARIRDNPQNMNLMIAGIRRAACALPTKTPLYAALVVILTNNEPFGKEFVANMVQALCKELSAALRDGRAGNARRSLRFLACLADCRIVSVKSLGEYIIRLLETSVFEISTAPRSERRVHCRGEFLADIALSALPWAGKPMSDRTPELLEQVMKHVDTIAKVWNPGQWRCVAPAKENRCIEIFAELLGAIFCLRRSKWICPREVVTLPHDFLSMSDNYAPEVELPSLNIPAHSKLTRYSCPRFRLFLVNEGPKKIENVVQGIPTKNLDVSHGTESPAEADTGKPLESDRETPIACPPDPNAPDAMAVDISAKTSSEASPMPASNDISNPGLGDNSNVRPDATAPDLTSQLAQNDTHNESKLSDPAAVVSLTLKHGEGDSKAGPDTKAPSESDAQTGSIEPGAIEPGAIEPGANGNKTPSDVMDTSSSGTAHANGALVSQGPPTEIDHVDAGKRMKSQEASPSLSVQQVPKRSPIINFVFRSYVSDIVDCFCGNHILAASRLLNLPLSQDFNDEIVEGVLSQMCSMPDPPVVHIYYGNLFVNLCRVKDSRLPAKLLTAVETIFQEAAEFDPETFDRLTEWFAFHLSNFGYKWNWADWALYADEDMADKFPYRALFCKDVLARCIRLSYHERILSMVPSELKFFLPTPPGSGKRERFDEAINNELMRIVTGRDKKDGPFVKNRLEELIPSDRAGDGEAEKKANLSRLAALTRSILQAGCKTLSHFDIVSERFQHLLRELTALGGHTGKRLVTLEVTCFWKGVNIRRMYVLDKLAARGVIDGQAVIDSCLAFERVTFDGINERLSEKEIAEGLCNSGNWEMLRMVLSRARSREEAARAELKYAAQSAAAANEGETENVESKLQQAKANTDKAKTDLAELLLVALRRLFGICATLLKANQIEMEGLELEAICATKCLPGFPNKPVWYWRCVGMIRELARKHPKHISIIIDQLDMDTRDDREEHRVLWESFEVIKEVEESAMLAQVS